MTIGGALLILTMAGGTFAIMIVAGAAGALIASHRHRSRAFWGILCFLLPFMILPAAIMSDWAPPPDTAGLKGFY